jgi:DNA-binding CsgD family transcriptional regulator
VREQEVLALIVAGSSNQHIARELHIGINTVKSLIRNAYRKVGVSTRAQAVAWGVEHGFPTRRGPSGGSRG